MDSVGIYYTDTEGEKQESTLGYNGGSWNRDTGGREIIEKRVDRRTIDEYDMKNESVVELDIQNFREMEPTEIVVRVFDSKHTEDYSAGKILTRNCREIVVYSGYTYAVEVYYDDQYVMSAFRCK